MATSYEILYFLDLLDEMGMDLNDLEGFVHDEGLREGGALSYLCHLEDAEDTKQARILLEALVKSKQGNVRISADELIQKLSSLVKDEHLDETLTRLELQRIPGIVARWKKLRAVPVVLLPGEKVTIYLRQATTCYLYGLPDATASLCRSVLQFALEEAMATPGGMSLDLMAKLDKKEYLTNLINFSRNTKILSPELAMKAHNVRKVGNDAIHKSNCTEPKALASIKETGEILSHLYRRTAQRGW